MATLHNRTTGDILARRVDFAESNADRVTALLPRRRAHSDEGLWFDRCQAVHTLGMHAIVDLVFLDRNLRVVRVDHAVRPGRPLVWCSRATSVLEMGYGFLAGCDVLVGDVLAFEEAKSA